METTYCGERSTRNSSPYEPHLLSKQRLNPKGSLSKYITSTAESGSPDLQRFLAAPLSKRARSPSDSPSKLHSNVRVKNLHFDGDPRPL
jgi:hypothetical protein